MPYQDPGSLDEETYWRLTAFLLRQNQIGGWQEPLGPQNASEVKLKSSAAPGPPATPVLEAAQVQGSSATPGPTTAAQPHLKDTGKSFPLPVILLGLFLLVLAIALAVARLAR
jgi:hypothetical protein